MGTPRNGPFKFENAWLSHHEFTNNIDKWWREDLKIQGTRMFLLQQKLKHIKSKIEIGTKGKLAISSKPKENLSRNFRRSIRAAS